LKIDFEIVGIMKAVSQMLSKVIKEERKYLLETEAKTVCMEYGILVYLKTSIHEP